jgi:ATP-dependent RNA helicase DeaD
MNSSEPAQAVAFADLGLSEQVLAAVAAIGYESASPIQAATIPALLEGADVLGQAQTGTGKTAAFALPILSRIDISQKAPQALVLVPTRELAIQVAEAFQKYATGLKGFHVLPIYGGQSYTPQLNALRRGTHVIVGTPGRIMDHMERGALTLDGIRTVVLDEADEMLAMGFADAMESILGKLPVERQVALFSATMAPNIKRIAQRHLRNPREVIIRSRTTTGANIRQRYWMVSGVHKLDALTRILEVEPFDAMLVFARTKQGTAELAEKLEARGFSAVALNGDVPQALRERIVSQLKAGKIDILVATDVAARGLDVERISHVVNFDVPYDTESYVHRIGRTGRAGRSGEAILFIAPRERNMLRLIERATRQPIEQMNLPGVEAVHARRYERFKERVVAALAAPPAQALRATITQLADETGSDPLDLAVALASMLDAGVPVLTAAAPNAPQHGNDRAPAFTPDDAQQQRDHSPREFAPRGEALPPLEFENPDAQEYWRLSVGRRHGVEPGQIVGALCHEGRLEGRQVNGIDIRADHSFVRLPAGMPAEVIAHLATVKVRGQALALERADPGRPMRRGPPADGARVAPWQRAKKPFHRGKG